MDDDVTPLSVPHKSASRKMVDRISGLAKGTIIVMPLPEIPLSCPFWGDDALNPNIGFQESFPLNPSNFRDIIVC